MAKKIKLTPERKGILMNAILGYLRTQNKEYNTEKCRQNLYHEQRSFCYGTMWLKLAYMSDASIDKIASKILG